MSDNLENKKPLIFTSRISQDEKNALYDFSEAYPASGLKELFHDSIGPVILDRLILAMGDLEVAANLLSKPESEAFLRASINRSYYAIHHSIRVMTLYKYHSEADGHEESIDEFEELLEDADFRIRCGLDESVGEDVAQARDHRSIADYSPFKWSRREGTVKWFKLLHDDWKAAAEFNLAVAKRVVAAADKFIGTI